MKNTYWQKYDHLPPKNANLLLGDRFNVVWLAPKNSNETGRLPEYFLVIPHVPVEPSSSVPVEPRRMSVWEWREFPGIKFTVNGRPGEHYWEEGALVNLIEPIFGTYAFILEAEGVEVIE